mmetsp:Transcript_4453/g.3682  ORF Transcript_4453/g.3682 Transcript_4453/m.3682 type:complete len:92 (-) Transcript_4453:159-434(-)|eukprot:CAMPEP_0114594978 /NCGR_PEP_ID=MMETSP0125-20121206/16686_1 /TAXON_ID=485358 ORGANISM="Aristerostoma sp., Strain ATCC 50986" /NCGR_SAMPLE_ID=MMETSP0125 /ASSEMBLY_ACC=CAM_ASM_000245 /LENGTH=91 /DNA_ID=CAMNT_0001795925 /DNA_START=126 /DNA_END=401 /DNA_ORIENTATION=+
MPVGVYTTNGADACKYIADHSEAELVLVENKEHLDKYFSLWDELSDIKYYVIYNDKMPENIPEDRKSKIMLWDDFMKLGKELLEKEGDKAV